MGKKIKCRTYDNKTVEVDVSELSFRPSVYGVVIKGDNVLLARQWDGYDVPGGGVDLGELLTDTVVREVKEETGLEVKPTQVLHVQDDFFFHPYKKKPFHTPLIYYYCQYLSCEISDKYFDEDEKEYAKKAQWMPISKVDDLKFYNPIDSPTIIKRALELSKTLAK